MIAISHKNNYNTMMRRLLLTTATIALGSLLPLQGLAYEPPEDVLFQPEDETQGFILQPPPSRREINSVVEEQQRRSAQRRAQQQQALVNQSSSAATAEEEEEAEGDVEVPAELEEILRSLEEEITSLREENESAEARRRDRIVGRIDANQDTLHGAAPAFEMDETMHSGAPLADTGPADWAWVVLLAGAGYWMIRKATKAGYIVVER